MQGLGSEQFEPVFLEILLVDPAHNHLVLSLCVLELEGIIGRQNHIFFINQHSAEKSRPFHYFIFGLSEYNLERVFVDGVFAHDDKHFKGPRELLSVTHEVRTVFFKMLVEGIKDSLEMQGLIVIILSDVLNLTKHTFSLMKS
jgi:hypothetical protein